MAAPEIKNTSVVFPSGERILRHEADINAAQVEVWNALTTTEGLHSFLSPVVAIDFRIGGKWEASYDPSSRIGEPGNIINEVISYLPMEMLSIRVVSTPPDFPSPSVGKSIWTVMFFTPVSETRTHVAISMAGWQKGPDWDTVWDLFDRGNAYTLMKLYERFENGPVKW